MYPTKWTEELYSNKLKYKEKKETRVTSSVWVQYTDEETHTEYNSTKKWTKEVKVIQQNVHGSLPDSTVTHNMILLNNTAYGS